MGLLSKRPLPCRFDHGTLVHACAAGLAELLKHFACDGAERRTNPELARQSERVLDVLQSQLRRENDGLIVVAPRHAHAVANDLWACRLAGADRLREQLRIEPGPLPERHGLSKRCDLYRAEHVDQELVRRAGTWRSEMKDAPRERL